MNRIAAVACLMVLPACASASGGAEETRTDRSTIAVERVGAATTTMELSRDEAVVTQELSVPPERAWMALVETYKALEIPVSGADERGWVLVATNQRLRRIGGRPLTAYFRCTGAYENLAATGDVFVTARTRLLPAEPSGTQARTEVSALAQARSGSGSRVACASTGILERAINEKLSELATRPPAR